MQFAGLSRIPTCDWLALPTACERGVYIQTLRTSCRLKRVRPHDGHETYSVLMFRIRQP